MNLTKHLWRKIMEIGLILTLMTIGIAIHPSTSYLKSIIHLIPFIRSVFLLGLIVSSIGVLGLAKSCETDREFRLNFGRALYLPSLIGIATVLLTEGLVRKMLTSIQFLVSALVFLFGFFISWTT